MLLRTMIPSINFYSIGAYKWVGLKNDESIQLRIIHGDWLLEPPGPFLLQLGKGSSLGSAMRKYNEQVE